MSCVCVCGCFCVYAASAPPPLLSILLSHWNKPGHVASPLSNSTPNTQTHSTLPPTAPQPLMDTEACRSSTVLFQLLWPSLSLSSAPPPIFLGDTKCTPYFQQRFIFNFCCNLPHRPFFPLSFSQRRIFSFIHGPPPPLYQN